MNVESITNLARHIWSSIVPPFLNLLFLGVVLGDTVVRQFDKSFLADWFDDSASHGLEVVSRLFKAVLSLFAFVDLSQLSKSLSVQNLSSVSVSLFVFAGLVFLILVYFVDNMTKLCAQLLKFCLESWQVQSLARRGTAFVGSMLAARGGGRLAAGVNRLEDLLHMRSARPELVAYARGVFFGAAEEAQAPIAEVHKVVVSWLFQNVKTGKWENDRQAINDRLRSLVAWEDYLRVYIGVTVLFMVISLFALFRWGVPILLIAILLVGKTTMSVAVLHARRQLIGRDLEEFYYFNLAAAPHAAAADTRAIA